MGSRIYSYIPEYPLDCGELGRHCATFTAVIDAEQNRFGWAYSIEIMKVIVDMRIGKDVHTIGVTAAFTENEHTRKRWEEEILNDYKAATNPDRFDEARD